MRENTKHEEPLEGMAGSLGSRAHPLLVEHSVNMTTKLPACVGLPEALQADGALYMTASGCSPGRLRIVCGTEAAFPCAQDSRPATGCVTGIWALTAWSAQFSSVAVVSDSLRPRGPQHARPPCPSPAPGACSDSCPLCRWCHPTISSSVIPFSSCLQSFPASGSFPMSRFFTSGD